MVRDSRVDEVRTRLALFILGLEERGHKVMPMLHDELVDFVIASSPVKIDVSDRDQLEKLLARKLGREFSSQLNEIMRLLGDPPRIENIPASFWETAGAGLRRAIMPVLAEIFRTQAANVLGSLPFGVDWALINNRAVEWARRYAFDMVHGLDTTSLDTLQRAIGSFYEDGLTRGELEELLRGSFGDMRAEMIAVTEVTRASSQGEQALMEELKKEGIEMVMVWQTNNDEVVCDICGPRHNKQRGDGWDDPPPAHPRCRCWVNLELPK